MELEWTWLRTALLWSGRRTDALKLYLVHNVTKETRSQGWCLVMLTENRKIRKNSLWFDFEKKRESNFNQAIDVPLSSHLFCLSSVLKIGENTTFQGLFNSAFVKKKNLDIISLRTTLLLRCWWMEMNGMFGLHTFVSVSDWGVEQLCWFCRIKLLYVCPLLFALPFTYSWSLCPLSDLWHIF